MDFCDLVVIGVGRASTVVLSAVNRYSAGERWRGASAERSCFGLDDC